MNSTLRVALTTTAEQIAQLRALQAGFAAVCNALAPVVRDTRCWNRVALHHMTYHDLRTRFPSIGSQMICNAIYSVSRMSRIVYQHPQSPWCIQKVGEKKLPLLRFLDNSPVYFDRHTLSLKKGKLSMYTLEGRIQFDLDLAEEAEVRFQQHKLREIVLTIGSQSAALEFHFSPNSDGVGAVGTPVNTDADLPEYLVVIAAEGVPVSSASISVTLRKNQSQTSLVA